MPAFVDRSFDAAKPRRVVGTFFRIPRTGCSVVGHEDDDGVVAQSSFVRNDSRRPMFSSMLTSMP